jgi:uncharacterized protein YkuJ
MIDGCCVLKVDDFHHENIYFVITYYQKNRRYCEQDGNMIMLPIFHFYKS